jgi:hypothetical protein
MDDNTSLSKIEEKKLTTFPSIIHLNIGGHLFTTTLSTLTRNPNTMLARMFSGAFAVATDKDGNYFIDRDGTHFRYILNYLRDGSCNFPKHVAKELLAEARFYAIDGLIKYIEQIYPETTYEISEAQRLEAIATELTRQNKANEIKRLTEWFLSEFRKCANNSRFHVWLIISRYNKNRDIYDLIADDSIRTVVLKDLATMGFKTVRLRQLSSGDGNFFYFEGSLIQPGHEISDKIDKLSQLLHNLSKESASGASLYTSVKYSSVSY